MRIHVYGAAGDVTGSCYLIETAKSRVLVDCGLFQGEADLPEKNVVPKGLDVSKLDAVVLTHAHNDHTGRLPLLVKAGYKNEIYGTAPTAQLARLILKDSAYLQEADAERENRKRERNDEPPIEPLYTIEHVEKLSGLLRLYPYDAPFSVTPDISFRAVDAGHILGSASLQFTVEEDGKQKKVVFSGDIGPRGAPFLRDPRLFDSADLVFLESTYGDRDHKPLEHTLREEREIVRDAVSRKSKILVPAFAIGRAQQIMYHLAALFRNGDVEPFPIFVDSPMAIEATKIYHQHTQLFDEEALDLIKSGQLADDWKWVRAVRLAEESKQLNHLKGPCMIIAGSGMCEGGRIVHHLKHNLWNKDVVVMIVGFQANGTLGRRLVDKHKKVRIFGEEIAVKARIVTLNGFSAHAGQKELLEWIGKLAPSKPRVALTHGETVPRATLAKLIRDKFQLETIEPRLNDIVVV